MSDRTAWDLVLARDDFSRTEFLERPLPEPGPDEVLLRVERVGVTANNVTYARLGEMMRYWDFFPTRTGWGRVPLWGFAEVERSSVSGLEVGERVYGYLPSSSHLIVRPKLTDAGFTDVSGHRLDLPKTYNVYAVTTEDPSYSAEYEDLQILYRPLFVTSFMLDDFLADNDFFGAEAMLVSSASSKTSYGTAFCTQLRSSRPRLIGLTSPSNIDFTRSLGIYDEVVAYEEVTELEAHEPLLYIDVSGNPQLRETVHGHFTRLVYDSIVGMTHDDATLSKTDELTGPEPVFFFAPDQIRKRRGDWGPGGIDERYGRAWREFAPAVKDWVDISVGIGREGLEAAWLDVLSGRAHPRVGQVIAL